MNAGDVVVIICISSLWLHIPVCFLHKSCVVNQTFYAFLLLVINSKIWRGGKKTNFCAMCIRHMVLNRSVLDRWCVIYDAVCLLPRTFPQYSVLSRGTRKPGSVIYNRGGFWDNTEKWFLTTPEKWFCDSNIKLVSEMNDANTMNNQR